MAYHKSMKTSEISLASAKRHNKERGGRHCRKRGQKIGNKDFYRDATTVEGNVYRSGYVIFYKDEAENERILLSSQGRLVEEKT